MIRHPIPSRLQQTGMFRQTVGGGGIAILIALLLIPPCLADDQAKQLPSVNRPNVILILTDDQGWGDLTCYNPDSKIETPSMDRLASEGLRMLNAYTPASVCSPTRYGLLTGRYPWRTWHKEGVLYHYDPSLIRPGRMTLGTLYQQIASRCEQPGLVKTVSPEIIWYSSLIPEYSRFVMIGGS